MKLYVIAGRNLREIINKTNETDMDKVISVVHDGESFYLIYQK